GQLRDIIAEAAGAELAEIGEVLAQLGGFDARDFGERFTGNRAHGIVLEPREAAQVDGQTINRFARNFWTVRFFQAGQEIVQTRRSCKPEEEETSFEVAEIPSLRNYDFDQWTGGLVLYQEPFFIA